MAEVLAADGAQLVFDSWFCEHDDESSQAIVLPGGPCRGVEYLSDLAGLSDDRVLVVLHPRGHRPPRPAHPGGGEPPAT